jgi:hypothetical protein
VLDNITEEQLNSLPLYSDFLDKNYTLPLITTVAKTYKGEKGDETSKYASYYDAKENTVRSETGELICNSKKGYLEIKAPRVQGIIGALNTKEFELPVMKIKVSNSWASVIAVSKDGKPLVDSKDFYLVVTGPTKMTDQVYNDPRSALKSSGHLPLLAQVIKGEILLKNKGKLQIIPLNISGLKGKALPLSAKEGGWSFDLASGRTFVYEIIVK